MIKFRPFTADMGALCGAHGQLVCKDGQSRDGPLVPAHTGQVGGIAKGPGRLALEAAGIEHHQGHLGQGAAERQSQGQLMEAQTGAQERGCPIESERRCRGAAGLGAHGRPHIEPQRQARAGQPGRRRGRKG